MSQLLFRNFQLLEPEVGALQGGHELLVEGDTVREVSGKPIKAEKADVVDCGGRTLMPGLVEGHAHLSFIGFQDLYDSVRLPVEEHLLATIEAARLLLDHGFTSCFSAASAKPRSESSVR